MYINRPILYTSGCIWETFLKNAFGCSCASQLLRGQFSYRFSVFPDNFTMIYKKNIEKIGWFQKTLWQLKVGSRKCLTILTILRNFRKFSKTWFFDFNRNSFENLKLMFWKNFEFFEIFSKFSNSQKQSRPDFKLS